MPSRSKSYRVKTYGKPTKGVVFFFCPFGIRRWQLLLPHLPIRNLMQAGFQVVCYDYNFLKITASPQQTKHILDEVLQDVAQKARVYKADGVQNISAFGSSLGTLFAAYCAAYVSEIQKVVLNLPYGDIVDHMIEFPGMALLPKGRARKYIALGGGEEALRKLFTGYSPLDNISELKNKKVLLYLTTKDRLLQYPNSSRLKKQLESSGNLEYVENQKLGHYWTATYNHFKRSVYIKFLQS